MTKKQDLRILYHKKGIEDILFNSIETTKLNLMMLGRREVNKIINKIMEFNFFLNTHTHTHTHKLKLTRA
jgi:hypothetical protein